MSAEDARKLFVGGLSEASSDEALRELFEASGYTVVHLAVPRDRESGLPRGFAFVTLSSEEDAQRARSELSGAMCEGRRITVREFAQDSQRKSAGRGAGKDPPTVFLGKLPFDATAEEITQLFDEHGVGPVSRVTLPVNADGRPRGFGFATLPDEEASREAVDKINGAELRGRHIVVSPAQPRGQSAPPRGPSAPPRAASSPPPARYEEKGPRAVRESPLPNVDPFEVSEPPPEGRGRRRQEPKKERKSPKKKGAGRGAKRERGGGGNWHQWDPDDD